MHLEVRVDLTKYVYLTYIILRFEKHVSYVANQLKLCGSSLKVPGQEQKT